MKSLFSSKVSKSTFFEDITILLSCAYNYYYYYKKINVSIHMFIFKNIISNILHTVYWWSILFILANLSSFYEITIIMKQYF